MDTDRAEAVLNGFSLVRNRIEAQRHLSLTCDQDWEIAARQ
ncbi:MAG TPA: hypothetical protein VK901_20730 [Nitrospiraceae bacterium]|nr:hypothetical protein [Nitrospiraceae bacterium]